MTILELTEINTKEREFLNEIHKTLLEFASELSMCHRKKVAAYIAKDNWGVIEINQSSHSCLMNGCYKNATESSKCKSVQAEIHAINYCKELGKDTIGSTMYVTHQPCKESAAAIINAQIKTVCFWEKSSDDDSIKMLENAGINVIQVRGDE